MPGFADRLRAAAYRFRLRQRIADAPTRNHHITNPWHAVSIVPGFVQGSCPQVAKLVGHRFLSMEAPPLPLVDCPMKNRCGCRFRHHVDRRSDARRAGDAGLPDHYYGPERRRKRRGGRRVTD
jgi:hypothetical protein